MYPEQSPFHQIFCDAPKNNGTGAHGALQYALFSIPCFPWMAGRPMGQDPGAFDRGNTALAGRMLLTISIWWQIAERTRYVEPDNRELFKWSTEIKNPDFSNNKDAKSPVGHDLSENMRVCCRTVCFPDIRQVNGFYPAALSQTLSRRWALAFVPVCLQVWPGTPEQGHDQHRPLMQTALPGLAALISPIR